MIPKSALNNDEAKNELDKIKEVGKTIDRKNLVFRASESTYNFRNFGIVRTFGRDIYESKITLEEANIDQDNLLKDIRNFNNKTRSQNDNKVQGKKIVLKNLYKFFETREILVDGFDSKIFLIKSKGLGLLNMDRSKLKILTPKQMLQRLPIARAQVKAGNNSESLLNQIRQIVYSLYQSKEITKEVYNNIITSIQKMNTIFMNSEHSKTSKCHVLVLKLTNKLDLRISEKVIALSNLSIYYTWKNIKSSCNNIKFKISAPT